MVDYQYRSRRQEGPLCSNYYRWLLCSRVAAAVLLQVQRIGRRMGEQKGHKVVAAAAAGTAS